MRLQVMKEVSENALRKSAIARAALSKPPSPNVSGPTEAQSSKSSKQPTSKRGVPLKRSGAFIGSGSAREVAARLTPTIVPPRPVLTINLPQPPPLKRSSLLSDGPIRTLSRPNHAGKFSLTMPAESNPFVRQTSIVVKEARQGAMLRDLFKYRKEYAEQFQYASTHLLYVIL